MKVLVTGGAGFIGSHVVERLLELGHEVRVYDKLVEQVHEGNGPRYVPEEAEFRLGDMSDRTTLESALQGIDQVVHLAAEVGVGQSMYEIERYVNANTGGTGVMLDILANGTDRISKLVVASSMSIYGEGLYECAEHGTQTPRLRQWEPGCPVCGSPLDPLPTAESKPLFPTSQRSEPLSIGTIPQPYPLRTTAGLLMNRRSTSRRWDGDEGAATVWSATVPSPESCLTSTSRPLR